MSKDEYIILDHCILEWEYMNDKPPKNRISAEEAVNILAKNGMKVTTSEAKNILDLLYLLAKLEVDHYLKR